MGRRDPYERAMERWRTEPWPPSQPNPVPAEEPWPPTPVGPRGTGLPRAAVQYVRELAREWTEDAIQALAEIVQDSRAPARARIAAAEALLDRGYGRPAQSVEVQAEVRQQLTISPDQAADIMRALEDVRRLRSGEIEAGAWVVRRILPVGEGELRETGSSPEDAPAGDPTPGPAPADAV